MISQSASADVVVVGSLNMDLIAYAPRLPSPGETLLGTRWMMAHGGKGGNQAVAAARLGAGVAMVGRVGQDAYGAALRDALLSEDIDCEGVLIDPAHPTGMAFITVGMQGQNSIVVIPGCNAELSSADMDAHREKIAAARVVICQLETPLSTVARAIGLARELDRFVILNPAPAPEPELLDEELLSGVDLLIPNQGETGHLTGHEVTSVEQAKVAADAFRSRGCGAVIVTLGEKGVVYVDRDCACHYPARVTEVVDATGAGDTFIGAVAACLSRGEEMAMAIRFGQCAAAISVGRRGAQSSIPTRAEVTPLMQAGTSQAGD